MMDGICTGCWRREQDEVRSVIMRDERWVSGDPFPATPAHIRESSNGRTGGFEPSNPGSNPGTRSVE